MLIIKKSGPVSSIYCDNRRIGGNRYQVNKVYISKYDSIDISVDDVITIIVNDNLSYNISLNSINSNVSTEEYVDALLKQSIRQEKLEEILK